MGKDVAEYKGIKYSLQPHGLKSRLLLALSFFVVAFGGALAMATSASAAETPSPSPSLTATPTDTPAPTPTPTFAATTPPPLIVTVTVVKTVVVTKTVTKTVPVTVTETEIVERHPDHPEVLAESSEPQPTPTPPATESRELANGMAMAVWGGAALVVSGVGGLIIAGVSSRARRRKYQGAHAGEQETQEFAVSDYHPTAGSGVSPELRDTMVLPSVSNERSSED